MSPLAFLVVHQVRHLIDRNNNVRHLRKRDKVPKVRDGVNSSLLVELCKYGLFIQQRSKKSRQEPRNSRFRRLQLFILNTDNSIVGNCNDSNILTIFEEIVQQPRLTMARRVSHVKDRHCIPVLALR